MPQICLELYSNSSKAWTPAAILKFHPGGDFELDYDLDYAADALDKKDDRALSLAYPVQIPKFKGTLPGFILDLIPQGDPLKRILSRHGITSADNYFDILSIIPLAAPGNIRIGEPWKTPGSNKGSHPGFLLQDILDHKEEFVSYMERSGAPIGGTSGVGGGSPKFLLREDFQGRYHAEGWLDDSKTRRALLVKFPYTDSQNSHELARLEKQYYDLIQDLPVRSGEPMRIHDDILFITRFDRIPEKGGLTYCGLESFYAAHNVNIPGAPLLHEDNLKLIAKHCSDPQAEILEYVKRDILNKALSNTDNHGRNSSFLKSDGNISLSPVYDLTAMRFFKGDFIVELTKWTNEHQQIRARLKWISQTFKLDEDRLVMELRSFRTLLSELEDRLADVGVSRDWIEKTSDDRRNAIQVLQALK